ncbi:MAG TPA: hypothetical protein VEA37_09380 [Flavobacterium sp.]|nr:hypothetical protein [Flavobacterium sp.]
MAGENIEVFAAFSKSGGFKPQAFKYGQQVYKVAKVDLQYSVKQGASKLYVFNVSDEVNSWVLSFDTGTMKWNLQNHAIFS